MNKFEALFEYASLGILIVNDRAEIILANNFLVSIFGYEDAGEIIGKKIDVLIPNRFHRVHSGHFEHYNKMPERRSMGIGKDLFAVKKDGSEFPVEISLSNFTVDKTLKTIAFVSDITKRKLIEADIIKQKEELTLSNLRIDELNNQLEKKVTERTKQLEKTLEELERSKAELMQSLNKEMELNDLKSRFVSMASHEFRTPLSTILSSASLVAKYTETDQQENRDKHIHRIKNSVNSLTDLLNEFLSIEKIEAGKISTNFSNFNIQELLAGICVEMQTLAKKDQKINYEHSGPTTVNLDSSLMKNAVLNLLSNAIKFSSAQSIITLTSKLKNNRLVIVVKDNGIGISAEDKKHLFERFFRGSNATNIEGTGLGLHIVSKYVELMNGKISYSSELEKGTTFTLTFKVI